MRRAGLHRVSRLLAVGAVLLACAAAIAAAAAGAPGPSRKLRRHSSGVISDGRGGDANATAQSAQPRLFFLFLTNTDVENKELWKHFFASQDTGQYRLFMHCNYEHVCKLKFSIMNSMDVTLVPTVPTTYCKDLVSAQVALLQAAVAESASPGDKFLFVSDSTLPVKPFPVVYQALTANADSDFCISPKSDWVRPPHHSGLLVKHGQWAVLNRHHAGAMVRHWPTIRDSYGVQSVCTDEWAPFATIYGGITDRGQGEEVLAGLGGGGQLQLQDEAAIQEGQGVCHTFAFWKVFSGDSAKLLQKFLADYPHTELSCYPTCDGRSHPARFKALSETGMKALRASKYLFARKFRKTGLDAQNFIRLVLT